MSEVIEKIKEKTNVVEINGKFKCRCPYHDDVDGNGSLIILPQNNTFHCFGCGQDGNIEALLEKLNETIY